MKKLGKILAPTDLSYLSRAGVRYALQIAKAQSAEVIIYHVIGHEEASPYVDVYDEDSLCTRAYRVAKDLRAQHQALLEEYIKENFGDLIAGVRIRPEVEMGTPYRRIVEKAAEEEVGVIVMATHGRTGLLHIGVGSVAKRVVRHAPCPVLSLRPKKTGNDRGRRNELSLGR
ncbi:MAG: universal stress protein [Deltaproteobacteria bacterium]|nr:universal stress protein [Deltaproteobacteria bacterium]